MDERALWLEIRCTLLFPTYVTTGSTTAAAAIVQVPRQRQVDRDLRVRGEGGGDAVGWGGHD